MKNLFLLIVVAFAATSVLSQTLKEWEEGYLDIHHINTGQGDCTFCILPDGTTLLIDAGENGRSGERVVAPKPDNSRSAGEWIADYVSSYMPEGKKYVDYYLLTHYHSDHIGGLSDVYRRLPAHKIIDRGDKLFLPFASDSYFADYNRFLHSITGKVINETFEIGTDEQFHLCYHQQKYPSFRIRNIYANGILAKEQNRLDTLFADRNDYAKKDMPRENMYSCVIKLSYGAFDYYTGGDIPGYPRPGRPSWQDVETPVSEVVGRVEVAVLNHHGNEDGTNECFLRNLSPQNIIMSTWDALHPNHTVLARALSKEIYPEERNVMSTNMHPATRIVIGALTDKMVSTQGHIVVRVLPDGDEYSIYILDDSVPEHPVKKEIGTFKCIK